MHVRDPLHRAPAAAGLATGGVLLGHSLTYALIHPGRVARDQLLASTGHSYLPAVNILAMVAVFVTLGWLSLGRLTRPWSTPSRRQLGGAIAGFQVGAFLAMEVLERLTSGAPLSGLSRGGLLPLGVLIQVAVAFVVLIVVRFVLRVSDRVAAALGRAPRHPAARSHVLRSPAPVARTHPDLLLAISRAPPPSA
ncbi:MAG: hypothetical protein ABI828_02825 [Actinomycetota bacterium]